MYNMLLARSAAGYRKHLQKTALAHPILANVCAKLQELINSTWQQRAQFQVQGNEFSVTDLPPIYDRAGLINEYTLGFGTPEAKILVIGLESAFDLGSHPNFSLEACSLTPVWLSESPPSLVAHIAGIITWANRLRPFHKYPGDYIAAEHTGTWGKLHWLVEGLPWPLLRPNATAVQTSFGDYSYLMDMSPRPALVNAAGQTLSLQRAAFLTRVAAVFGQTARILLFHGKGNKEQERTFGDTQLRMASAFLGVPAGQLTMRTTNAGRPGGNRQPITWTENQQGQRVVWIKNLGNHFSERYRAHFHTAVLPALT